MEKKADREESERRNLAFAKQMIKDSEVALVLEAREREVPIPFGCPTVTVYLHYNETRKPH